MFNARRPLRSLALVVSLAVMGCHAQTPPPSAAAAAQTGVQPGVVFNVQPGVKLSADLTRRIEIMIRSRSDIPADYIITVGDPEKSDISGYALVNVSFAAQGATLKSSPFLLSTDGKTLAQFNRFDISQNPMDKVSFVGRPARGGPATAPVTVVGFDDLECPFCAIMNAELFPAILDRYKDQVRIVYRDFPLAEIHPWATRAAIDANCLASVSVPGYWNFVDYVHAHAADIAGTEKTLAKASQNLDKIALDEGTRQKVDPSSLNACVAKQDATAVKQSVLLAESEPLRVDSAPLLYINGEKVMGVVPIETLYRIIDRALVAAGQTPPPPPPPAVQPAPSSPAAQPAAKPGS